MAVYRIDPFTGYMKIQDSSHALERHQDFSASDQMENVMWQNEDSDTIIEFTFDENTGWLVPTMNIIETGSPVCITFR